MIGALAGSITMAAGGTSQTTSYTYAYWDGAKQATIKIQASNANVSNWAPGLSNLTYDVNGYLKTAVDTAGGKTVNFINNANGQVLLRTSSGYPFYQTHWYYAQGQRVGDVSTDPAAASYRTSYAEALAQSDAAQKNPDAYRNLAPVSSASFDNYEPVSPSYPPATGSAYTVRAGDTLPSISQALWGDSTLWYLIAQANGLSSAQNLTAGQVLVIPNKLTNIHNNSSTFRPYNPAEAVGRIDPTLPTAPPPPPQPGGDDGDCSVFGAIVSVIVYVVVIYYTGSPVIAAAASNTAGQIGTAIDRGEYDLERLVTHNLVPQSGEDVLNTLFNPAVNGMENGKFDHGSVARSAAVAYLVQRYGPSGSDSGEVGQAGGLDWSSVASGALQGAESTALNLALQGKWNWREVAAGAIGGAAGAAAGQVSSNPIVSNVASGLASSRVSSKVMGLDNDATRSAMGQAFLSSLGSGIVQSLKPPRTQADPLGDFIQQNQDRWDQRQATYDQVVGAFGNAGSSDMSNGVRLAAGNGFITDTSTNAEILAYDLKNQGFGDDWSLDNAALKFDRKIAFSGSGLKPDVNPFSYKSQLDYSVNADYSLDVSGQRLSTQADVSGWLAAWETAKGVFNSVVVSTGDAFYKAAGYLALSDPSVVYARIQNPSMSAALDSQAALGMPGLSLPRFDYSTPYGPLAEQVADYAQLGMAGYGLTKMAISGLGLGLKSGLVGAAGLSYSLDADASPLSGLRRMMTSVLGDSGELVRMTNSGVAVFRTGESSYAQIGGLVVNRGSAAVRNDLAALRDLEPIAGSVQRAAQEIRDGYRFDRLSPEWKDALTQARIDYADRPWIITRMESGAIGGYVDAGIGLRVKNEFIPEAAGFVKNHVGPDLTKPGLLPIEVTQYTPSLSAITTHAQRYNLSLAYSLYTKPGLGFKP